MKKPRHGISAASFAMTLAAAAVLMFAWLPLSDATIPIANHGPILLESDAALCVADGGGGWLDSGVTNCGLADGSAGAPFTVRGWNVTRLVISNVTKSISVLDVTKISDSGQSLPAQYFVFQNLTGQMHLRNVTAPVWFSGIQQPVGILNSTMSELRTEHAALNVSGTDLGLVSVGDGADTVITNSSIDLVWARSQNGSSAALVRFEVENSLVNQGGLRMPVLGLPCLEENHDFAPRGMTGLATTEAVLNSTRMKITPVGKVRFHGNEIIGGVVTQGGCEIAFLNNSFENTVLTALSISGASDSIDVKGNLFRNNGAGVPNGGCQGGALSISQSPSFLVWLATINVSNNRFEGNCFGLAAIQAPPMGAKGSSTAALNWWNSIAGPSLLFNDGPQDGAGDRYVGTLPFMPWCSDAGCTSFGP